MLNVLLNVLNKETTEAMDYTELLCWLLDNKGDDLLVMTAKEYKRFCESDNEDDTMDMEVTNTSKIALEGIAGIDVYDEDNFISARITDNENDIFLTIKWGSKGKDFVLLYA